jgi:hypothetical protein
LTAENDHSVAKDSNPLFPIGRISYKLSSLETIGIDESLASPSGCSPVGYKLLHRFDEMVFQFIQLIYLIAHLMAAINL